jgi:endo-1,4-beta-D-glucanase Y
MQQLREGGMGRRKQLLIIIGVLLFSGIAHGINMFNFPYFENDEGIYISQGWSVFNLSQLSPYTYWYDHAPLGWIVIGLWQRLTGGVFAFGESVASGRALMLLIHVLTAGGLLFIGKKITGKNLAGILAVVVFSLSPLAIYYQRRVLLDNLATFWVVLSISALMRRPLKVWPSMLAAVFAGFSVLSKEVAIFFIPAWLYVIWVNSKKNLPFVLAVWLSTFGLIVSTYFLFAWLKGELLPYGFLGDFRERVSLLDTVGQQLNRGFNYPFWDQRSLFFQNFQGWLIKDPVLTWGAVIVLVTSAILAIPVKKIRIPAIFSWCFAIFLLRSRLVIDFYIIPLIPMVALSYGVLADLLWSRINDHDLKTWVATVVIAITAVGIGFRNIGQYSKDENKALRNTIDFVKKTAQADDLIIADSSIYLDLKLSRYPGDSVLSNVHWAWKIEGDKQISKNVMKDDWRNIRYLMLSHEMLKQIRDFDAKTIKEAVNNSDQMIMYTTGSTSYIDISKYISTNGDWMGVLKVKDQTSIVLDNAWKFYKENFIYDYGQVIDPAISVTTSEGQAYAMLRAVWENDQQTFNGLWNWTQDHMQYRGVDKLFSWKFVKQDNAFVLGDPASASDADIDIALALLQAGKRWQTEKYINSARTIIEDIWKKEVILIGNKYYLIAGSNAKAENGYLVNPSYFSPAAYQIFASVDPSHNWSKLIEDTYFVLDRLQKSNISPSGLIPDWIWVEETSGAIKDGDIYLGRNGYKYGYDAFRTYFRISMDKEWYKRETAINFLDASGKFFADEWENVGVIYSEYSLDGKPLTENSSIATSVGALFATNDYKKDIAIDIYKKTFDQTKNINFDGSWGDSKNYYDQNWAWFATAMFEGRLVNYW